MRIVVGLAVSTILIPTAGTAALDVVRPEPRPVLENQDLQPRRLEERLAELARREEAVAARSWEGVLAEVEERARALGVGAPADELTRLLFERAWLELAGERCELGAEDAVECEPVRADLSALEAEFAALAGMSPDAFRQGRRLRDLTPTAAPLILPGGSTRTDPDFCECDVTVSNFNRWMNRWWGLECACHTGHGVCSNNLDWCGVHSPGLGAMTGSITLGFAQEWRVRDCPDDHRTCFKGPKPSKPNGGEWTNVCSCDTVHSQYSDPLAAFYGGDVSDASLVTQASFLNVRRDGSCSNQGMTVFEAIEEHDPVCCDDPMGTLVASLQIADGTTTRDLPDSAQNCNGGSQSGVPPYCGSFGATIRVQATCQTLPDDEFGSCWGRCGEVLPDATCNCDFECQNEGDCCSDYCDACAAQGEQVPFPCDVGSV